jgi:hypothetical protein
MGEQAPLAPGEAWRAVAACFLTTFPLLALHRIHLPKERVGTRLRFGAGPVGLAAAMTARLYSATQDHRCRPVPLQARSRHPAGCRRRRTARTADRRPVRGARRRRRHRSRRRPGQLRAVHASRTPGRAHRQHRHARQAGHAAPRGTVAHEHDDQHRPGGHLLHTLAARPGDVRTPAHLSPRHPYLRSRPDGGRLRGLLPRHRHGRSQGGALPRTAPGPTAVTTVQRLRPLCRPASWPGPFGPGDRRWTVLPWK